MRTILTLVLIGLFGALNAQTMTFVETTNGNELHNVSLTIADTVYNAVITSKGSYKIERISASGNTYWMYLGYKTNETYTKNNIVHTVFKDTKENYSYYIVGDTGYPLKRKLNTN